MKITPVFSLNFMKKVELYDLESQRLLVNLATILHTACTHVPARICCSGPVSELFKGMASIPALEINVNDYHWEIGAEITYPGFDVILMVDTDATTEGGGPVNILPAEFDYFHRVLSRMEHDRNEGRFDLDIEDFRKCSKYHSTIMTTQAELLDRQRSMYQFSS